MKTLTFGYNDATVYEILYEALGVSSVGYKGLQTRMVARVFNTLESIGRLKSGIDGQRGLYTLDSNEQPIITQLEDAEYDLLKTAFENTEWNGIGARRAALVYDWFSKSVTNVTDDDSYTNRPTPVKPPLKVV